MTYSRITKAQFDEMQFDAGVLVSRFNIQNPYINDEDIVCATTGGFSLSVEPIYVDLGSDIYMMEKNTAEMMLLTGWTVESSFTAIGFGSSTLSMILGAADVENSVTPRKELRIDDFADLWWIGERVDGGFVSVKLCNALSDEGLSITTTSNGRGEIGVHLTAHASFEDDDITAVPVEIYSVESRPFFWISEHKFLYYSGTDDDVFRLDEATGKLYITENGDWHYTVNKQTGMMEVSKD